MPRIVINGREVRSPVARFVLLVVASVIAAIVLASAGAWLLIFLGVGTVVVIVVSVAALLFAAGAVAWALLSALVRRADRTGRW